MINQQSINPSDIKGISLLLDCFLLANDIHGNKIDIKLVDHEAIRPMDVFQSSSVFVFDFYTGLFLDEPPFTYTNGVIEGARPFYLLIKLR